MGFVTVRVPDNLEKEMDCYVHEIAETRSEFIRKSIRRQIREIKEKNEIKRNV